MASTNFGVDGPFDDFVGQVDFSNLPAAEMDELLRSVQQYNDQHPDQNTFGPLVDPNLVMQPPYAQTSGSPSKRPSPKTDHAAHIDPSSLGSINIQAPMPTDFSTDSLPKQHGVGPYFNVATPMFSTFSTTKPVARPHSRAGEASRPQSRSGEVARPHTMAGAVARPQSKAGESARPSSRSGEPARPGSKSGSSSVLGKRQAPDGGSAKPPPKRRIVEEDNLGPMPDPEDMPEIIDEGGKPPYSYAQLIGMAILRGKDRRMTLAQIYKWINDTFEFYRNAGTGWQNSIRHNLSLNKAFVKIERPKNDPGKGNYWTIAQGSEPQFWGNKLMRRVFPSGGQAGTAYAPYIDPAPSDTYQLPPAAPEPAAALPAPVNRKVLDSSRFPADNDVSSDGTIADPTLADQDEPEMPPPRRAQRGQRQTTSPQPEMHSSPPVPRHSSGTPSLGVFHHASRSGGRGTHRAPTFKDSGFYSSIESSVPRSKPAGPMNLTSEAENRSSVLKRGRAEDEIARMRSSSFDPSPSRASKRIKLASGAPVPAPSSALNSSSPLRATELHFPPLTPGAPIAPVPRPIGKPPPNVSPGTLLQRHRDSVRALIGTPHVFKSREPNDPFGPNDPTPAKDDGEFDPFEGLEEWANEVGPSVGIPRSITRSVTPNGSPVARKASLPRPGPAARAHTSSGVLGDITNSSRKNLRLASPFRMTPSAAIRDQTRSVSPIKKQGLHEPLKSDAFFGCLNTSDLDDPFAASPDRGMDLLRGFRTIGSGQENTSKAPQHPASATKNSRGTLNRTLSNFS